ncbi:hypothetical protein [Epilithonimonas vandammei]|uniref:hypothetical protein n=1 Tax=Epilithonimonas vandammei TaxID=2487072 RepID=UPI0028AA3ED9|nr:hypothetical protein [Epilithonimonas vandammei]
MKIYLKKINTSLIGFILVLHLFISLLITNVGFVFGFPVQFFYYPLSLLLCLIIYKNNLPTCIVLFSLLVFSFVISRIVFDNSYDGQYYHQETMIQLKNGWNPIYSLSNSRTGKFWIDNYPKGAETLSSLIYIFTDKIEEGKCINWIALFASFFMSYSVLRLLEIKRTLKVLFAFLIAFNPVVISQVFTYYIDALVYSFFVCCLCSMTLYLKEKKNMYLYIFIGSLVLGSSIKFTSIVIFGVFIVVSLLCVIFILKQKYLFFKLFYSSCLGFFLLILVTINPYANNLINGRHLFYPLLGKGSVEIMYLTAPKDFVDGYNRIEKLGITLFGKTGFLDANDIRFKIPFSVHKSEIIKLTESDIMIGGFGVFYGGFLLLLLIVLLFNLEKFKNFSSTQKLLLMSIVPIFFSVLIISDPWWVRYIPQFYLIPIIILFVLQINQVKIKVLPLLYSVLIINVGLFLLAISISNYYKSQKFYYILESLKKSQRTVKIDTHQFKSTLNRLEEYNISYKEIKINNDDKKVIKFQPKGAVIKDESFVKVERNKIFDFLQKNLYMD